MKVLASMASSAFAAEKQMPKYAKKVLPDSLGITETLPEPKSKVHLQQATENPSKTEASDTGQRRGQNCVGDRLAPRKAGMKMAEWLYEEP